VGVKKHWSKTMNPHLQNILHNITTRLAALEEVQAKQDQGEPVAIIHRNEYNEYRLEPHDNFDIKSIPFNVDVPLFKSLQGEWVKLMRGVRVEGDTVVISVKGGNEAARELCGELINEMTK